jgi:tRNA A37 threonylcarbamoyladenosine dehydratase
VHQNLLSVDLNRRFSGLERLYGRQPYGAVRDAHVAVVGIGGVGSWAAEALARSGVSQLTLIDMDHISESNINRQVHAISSTTGMAKVVAMKSRIESINPSCGVTCVDEFVTAENWPRLLPDGVDAVIDCCDQFKAKVAMASWALREKAVFITVGAAGGKRHAHKVDLADLSQTTHDPLMAKVRYNLRKAHGARKDGKQIGIPCVFSREPLQRADVSCAAQEDSTLNCHGYGSLVSVTATFGLCAAGWVVNAISSGVNDLSSRTLPATYSTRTLSGARASM